MRWTSAVGVPIIIQMVRVGGMSVVALLVCVACGASVACNALSGGDKLGVEPGNDDVPLRERTPSAPDDASSTTTPIDGRTTADGGTGTVSDASFDATTTSPIVFADAFDRADGTIGNGWLEKTAGKFSLSERSVLQPTTVKGDTYYNLIVRRPAAEAVRDVQIAFDFTYGASTDSDPTLYARMQPNSDTVDVLSGYTFYLFDNFAGFTREDGATTVTIQSNAVTPTIAAGSTVHILFRVRGTDPVTLEAAVTNADGSSIINLSTSDNDPKRVITAGQVGFGASKAALGRWDNFEQRNL